MNQINYDGAYNVAGQANNMFNAGMKGLTSAINSYRGRVKNNAINKILGTEKLIDEDAVGYQGRVNTLLGNIDDLDPLQRLNLSTVASKPIYEQELREREVEQQTYDRGVDSAKLVMKSDEIQNTEDYRDTVTGETSRHNEVMEIPNDIREATQAGYPSQMTRVRSDGKSDYRLSEKDFQRYQVDKSKASHSSRELDPSTVNKNNAQTFKIFDDAMFKSLGEDGYAEFQKEDPATKAKVYKYWQATNSLGYGVKSGNDDYYDNREYGAQDMPETDTTAVPNDIKYVGNQAFSADGSRAPQYDK